MWGTRFLPFSQLLLTHLSLITLSNRLTLTMTLAAGISSAAAARVHAQPQHRPAAVASLRGEAWVQATLKRLTLGQKAGQLFFPQVPGSYLSTHSEAYDNLYDWVATQGVGGVVVSIGPALEIAAKLNLLQQAADVPLLVAADVERGAGQILNGGVILPYPLINGGGTQAPPVMSIGAAGDERLAYQLGRITADEARAVGIHMALAPVADVNVNPDNPIINTRSYGEDPQKVAKMVAAQIRGLQDNGMIATAKHFPGHGDVDTDTHLDLPVLGITKARADSIELVPFRAAVNAGVGAVMSAHIAFPAITGDTTPATLTPKLVTGVLRGELGFEGLALTDALDMGGVVKKYGSAEPAVLAILAGADIMIMPLDLHVAIDAVVQAVQSGRISRARLDSSVVKILRAKASLGLDRQRTIDLMKVADHVGTREHMAFAQEVANRSITVARDRQHLLPLVPNDRNLLSIVYGDDPDPLAGRYFQAEIRTRFPRAVTAFVDRSTSAAALDSLLTRADSADVVLFSPFVSQRDHKGHVTIVSNVAAFAARVTQLRPTIVTAFGNPYVLSQFPDAGTYVLAWGLEEMPQRAAARAITGEIPITGTLPISLPPFHKAGEGLQIPARAATGGAQ
jgi:beta-N-acetylhexosaminidase